MTLIARERRVPTEVGDERELVVACPQRIDPVSIRQCAACDLCEGLDLNGAVGVRCAVEPSGGEDTGAPPAHARITTLMTADVVTVQHDASIENVQWLLVERGIGAVPVIGNDGQPCGILAKTDLLRARDEPAVSARPVHEDGAPDPAASGLCASDLMTPVIHCVTEYATIAATAALMAREHVHHALVVTDAGAMRGIVSSLDIARWVAARERFAPREVR